MFQHSWIGIYTLIQLTRKKRNFMLSAVLHFDFFFDWTSASQFPRYDNKQRILMFNLSKRYGIANSTTEKIISAITETSHFVELKGFVEWFHQKFCQFLPKLTLKALCYTVFALKKTVRDSKARAGTVRFYSTVPYYI